MAITHISRDWGANPSIVRIISTDSLNELLTPGYLSGESTTIESLNNGEFTWKDSDLLAVSCSDAKAILGRDTDGNLSFVVGENQYVSVTLTAAQVLGMYAAPVQIIAAPGDDRMIRVHDAELVVDWVSAQYAAGGVIALQYDDTVNGAGLDASADLAAATLNGYTADSTVGLAGESESGAAASKVNVGIFISNETQAFTTGDSPVTVNVWFSVINAGL